MAREAHSEALRWVDLLMRPVGVLGLFRGAEERLSSATLGRCLLAAHGTASRSCAHASTCSSKLLHLVVVAILEGDEALSNLEEVAIGLVRGEVAVKDKARVGCNLFLSREHFEGVLDHLASSLVQDGEECPVDSDWEAKFVL